MSSEVLTNSKDHKSKRIAFTKHSTMKFLLFVAWAASMAAPSTAFVSPSDPKRSSPAIKAEFDRGNKAGNSKSAVLDGTYPGDYGFDPLGFAKTKESLTYYREAEVKHARLVRQICLRQVNFFHHLTHMPS
jgi:hypothetical protein